MKIALLLRRAYRSSIFPFTSIITSMPPSNQSQRPVYTGDNPLWTEVDTYTTTHLHPSSRPNTPFLSATLSASNANNLPPYALSPAQAKFLALHIRSTGVTHALEIGTLGGYAALWLASTNSALHVTTIEANAHHAAVARRNVEAAGLRARVEVINGAALDVLPVLGGEVRSGARPRFGFVFIDADKVNNWAYFQAAREMIAVRGVICVDNVVRNGGLVGGGIGDTSVRGSREVVEEIGKMEGVEAVVLQTVGEKGYDGWLWAVVDEGGIRDEVCGMVGDG